MGRWIYSIADLQDAVKNSNSIAGVARMLGLATSGGGFRTIKKRIQELKLDTSHFNPAENQIRALRANGKKRKHQFEDLFREKCTVNRYIVKKYIRDQALIPYKCANCGLDPLWNGKPLVLQLEHKNGISNDNRLENLTFLCPNCHSQTSTFAGRQMTPDRWVDGQKLDRRRKGLCRVVRNMKFDRGIARELYAEHRNYTHVGRLLGVSGNAIKKALKVHNPHS